MQTRCVLMLRANIVAIPEQTAITRTVRASRFLIGSHRLDIYATTPAFLKCLPSSR